MLIKGVMSRDLNVDHIKKLWILDLIIRLGSMKRAAVQAKLSPSAVSQALSSLEHSTGKPLIVREKGLVTPTPEALSILNVVRPAFDVFERLKSLNAAEAPQMTWLNFGTYESIAVDILPGLIHRLRTLMPRLRLELRISRTVNLLTMLRKGELCSALVAEVDDLSRFYQKTVCEDRLGFFVSARHPISELGWKAVTEFGVGSLSPSKERLPRYFMRFLKQAGGLRVSIYSDSFEALRCAASAGALVSVLPHRVATRRDDLMEIFPERGKLRDNGKHRLLVVSLANCDKDEVDFLAGATQRLLSQSSNVPALSSVATTPPIT
ncbi:MAG: LysR family transcriptional regulator [Bdellovibrionales bacterium]